MDREIKWILKTHNYINMIIWEQMIITVISPLLLILRRQSKTFNSLRVWSCNVCSQQSYTMVIYSHDVGEILKTLQHKLITEYLRYSWRPNNYNDLISYLISSWGWLPYAQPWWLTFLLQTWWLLYRWSWITTSRYCFGNLKDLP